MNWKSGSAGGVDGWRLVIVLPVVVGGEVVERRQVVFGDEPGGHGVLNES